MWIVIEGKEDGQKKRYEYYLLDLYDKNTDTYAAGGWSINAEMDASKTACIEVFNNDGTVIHICFPITKLVD